MAENATPPDSFSGGDDADRDTSGETELPHPLEELSEEELSAKEAADKDVSGEARLGSSSDPEAASGADVSLGVSARARHLRSGWVPDGYRADWVRRVAENTAEAAGLPLVDWLGKEGLGHFFAVEPVTGIGAPAHLRVTIDPFEAEVATLRVGPTTEAGETVAVFKLAGGPVLGGSELSSSEKEENRSRPAEGGRAARMELSRVERPALFEALTRSEPSRSGVSLFDDSSGEGETPESEPASS